VTFFDVGQGDAILIRSAFHNVLVDGGGRVDDARFGESVVLPLLVDRGVHHLDIVVLTHAHPDHCGGLESVLRHLGVGEVWISPRRFRGECARRLLDVIAKRNVRVRLIRGHHSVTLGALRLNATTSGRAHRRAAENNSSIVIRAEWPDRSVLLTGDIEREAEAALEFAPVDVMKVPHHGSRTSTSRFLLDRAKPAVAVISCGRRNVFGHPHPDVLSALAERHVRVWRTDRSGTVVCDITPQGVRVIPQIDTAQ
jgi:competence protein ComEC